MKINFETYFIYIALLWNIFYSNLLSSNKNKNTFRNIFNWEKMCRKIKWRKVGSFLGLSEFLDKCWIMGWLN